MPFLFCMHVHQLQLENATKIGLHYHYKALRSDDFAGKSVNRLV